MSLLNPMNIGAPGAPYQQPNSGNPSPQAGVANYPTGANVMNLVWPIVAPPQQDGLFPSQATLQLDPAGGIQPHEVS